MPTVPEFLTQRYRIQREVTQSADLVVQLLARLTYAPVRQQPAAVNELVKQIKAAQQGSPLPCVDASDQNHERLGRFLWDYLLLLRTTKGQTFYPLHPALTLSTNGEGSRMASFVDALASQFTADEAATLRHRLWSDSRLGGFERVLHDLIDWTVAPDVAPQAEAPVSPVTADSFDPSTPEGLLSGTKSDLLTLAELCTGIQAFTIHAGRLLALSVTRYLLARSSIHLDLPIYAAPSADSHEGAKTLAHEIIEIHRTRFARALRRDFQLALSDALAADGEDGALIDEVQARSISAQLFDPRSNIVPPGQMDQLLAEHGSYSAIAENYYWSHTGARNRFLRLLHATHLNMAKKAGIASSRSRYSQWHFYWLSPDLTETLLLLTQARHPTESRLLVADLLAEWRDRFGLAMLIDDTWISAYREHFRGLGSPEALNEVNRRRFTEVLAERGRLHKNSDDFPWVVLRTES